MAHFAKIEGGKVVNVIVVDSAESFDGVWVQTSYNARGGTHYDANGNPTDLPALRKNYAGIGYIYDEALDAFYEDRAGDPTVELDPVTCLWIEKPVAPT